MVDKDRLMTRITLPIVSQIPYQPPTEADFLNVVNDFWYHAIWTTKKLQRGEVWTAKGSVDSYMKQLLLSMMEWHAHATAKGTADTWFNGRFLEEWADPRVLAELKDTFSRYDSADVKRGLLATMNLFRWLAKETAGQLTYAYPLLEDARITQWVMEQLGIKESIDSAPKVAETAPHAPIAAPKPEDAAPPVPPAVPKPEDAVPPLPPTAPEAGKSESSS
jgi:aminoglycoside 6-adenylyltransferase